MVIMIISFRTEKAKAQIARNSISGYSVIKNLAPITIYDTFRYAASDLS